MPSQDPLPSVTQAARELADLLEPIIGQLPKSIKKALKSLREAIAAQLEVRQRATANRTNPGRKRQIDHEEILRLNAQGVTRTEIAQQLGVSRSSVDTIIREHQRRSSE